MHVLQPRAACPCVQRRRRHTHTHTHTGRTRAHTHTSLRSAQARGAHACSRAHARGPHALIQRRALAQDRGGLHTCVFVRSSVSFVCSSVSFVVSFTRLAACAHLRACACAHGRAGRVISTPGPFFWSNRPRSRRGSWFELFRLAHPRNKHARTRTHSRTIDADLHGRRHAHSGIFKVVVLRLQFATNAHPAY